MAKDVCCLCKFNIGGFMGYKGGRISESYINDIPASSGAFPASPYKQYTKGDAYICEFCATYVANLFGCDLDKSALPFKLRANTCTKEKMEKAKQEVRKRLDFKPRGVKFAIDPKDLTFFEYALTVPKVIEQFHETKRAEVVDVTNKLIADQESVFLKIFDRIRQQNQFAESESYTFGVVNDTLLYVPFSQISTRKHIAEIRSTRDWILQCVRDHMYFDWMLKDLVQEVNKTKYDIVQIPLNKIKHFKIMGSIGYSSNVYGGGGSGGGVNLGGAIAGGLLFGGIGAMIGSQMNTEIKINPIHTVVTKHDDRNVEFFYQDETGKTVSTIFNPSAYDCLMKIIPEKSYDSVIVENTSTIAKTTKQDNQPKVEKSEVKAQQIAAGKSSLSELKELKELLDLGIITQEEFDAKKKQLLGL